MPLSPGLFRHMLGSAAAIELKPLYLNGKDAGHLLAYSLHKYIETGGQLGLETGESYGGL
jgi:hypothetical protein